MNSRMGCLIKGNLFNLLRTLSETLRNFRMGFLTLKDILVDFQLSKILNLKHPAKPRPIYTPLFKMSSLIKENSFIFLRSLPGTLGTKNSFFLISNYQCSIQKFLVKFKLSPHAFFTDAIKLFYFRLKG